MGTEPVATEKQQGHGQSQLLSGDITGMSGAACQLGRLTSFQRGKACSAGWLSLSHGFVSGFYPQACRVL